jgi:hypothetical protein
MKRRFTFGIALLALAAAAALFIAPGASSSSKRLTVLSPSQMPFGHRCATPGADFLCTDVMDYLSKDTVVGGSANGTVPWTGPYLGHDEPSALFYSHVPGSGNDTTFNLTLPKQPPAFPAQNGSGTAWDFQLHPAFWFGMAMCDNTSYPNYTSTCTPDSDSNIYNDPSPASPHFISKHPGGAYMEMQFYPPGWAPWFDTTSCSATQWCASLNVDSFNVISATNSFSNFTCSSAIGTLEPFNFAYLTKGTSGLGANGPANQWDATVATYVPGSNNLFMNGGDKLTVHMFDTPAGMKVIVNDANTGQSGAMIAGPANGFAHPLVGNGNTCDSPYAFHPMYSTSTPATRLQWTAHSYNIAYSDEIGHFQNCTPVAPGTFFNPYRPCTGVENPDGGAAEAKDADDTNCINGASLTLLVPLDGCIGNNNGFDGSSYIAKDWPGNGNDLNTPTPIRFSSPYANSNKITGQFATVGFESDGIAVQSGAGAYFPGESCSTHNPAQPGSTCMLPMPTDDSNATLVPPLIEQGFYPMYTAVQTSGPVGACVYQEGGANYGTVLNSFGGSATQEYGPPYPTIYPQDGSNNTAIITRFENWHQEFANPCKNPGN